MLSSKLADFDDLSWIVHQNIVGRKNRTEFYFHDLATTKKNFPGQVTRNKQFL